MIRFKSLTLKNFLSYGAVPTVIDLEQIGSTLIVGQDLDNTTNGEVSNGVGKTVIINALAYVLYDKPISKISLDNLVNDINKKNMEVIITFIKDNIDYTIKRCRKMKAGAAGNYVQLFKRDKDITPAGVANTNKLIEKILNLPYDLFVRVAAFSATHTPFLDLPVRSRYEANQTSIIEELFGLTALSEKADLLKAVIKDTEQSLKTHKLKVEFAEKEQSRLNEQIQSALVRKQSWDTKNTNEIKQLQTKLKQISEIDIEKQQQAYQELNVVDGDLNAALAEQRQLELRLVQLSKSIKKLNSELEQLQKAKCPYCKQDYHDAEDKVKECEININEQTAELDELTDRLETVDASIVLLTKDHKKLSANITVDNMQELMDIHNKLSLYEDKLKELKNNINPFIEPLQELKDTVIEKVDTEKVNDLQDLINHQKFLLKLLTKKDSFVRKALLNKNIPFLNKRLSYYIKEMGLPHLVEFTFEMTAKISRFGREMDFGNLSSGQRARVNLALSLAFRDVLQTLHDSINVCMFDEVLDVGLDEVGVQHAARILKRKARDEKLSLFVVSHRNEIGNAFDRKMIVQMSKGFSSIIYEE